MSKADRRARKRQNQQLAALERQRMQQRAQRNRWIKLGAVIVVALLALVGVLTVTGGNGKKPAATARTTTTKPATATTKPTPTTALPALTKTACNSTKPPAARPKQYKAAPPQTIDPTKTYTATIVTSCGTMVAQLDAKNSPVAVNNFVFLAKAGFYNGLTWHRVVKNFVIQGGDPKGDGSGGPGYTVKGEAPKSGTYSLGALAAAKTNSDPTGTMGSQFFVITGTDGMALPPQYAYFGAVTKGVDVARTLESFSTGDGPPPRPLYIVTITITEK